MVYRFLLKRQTMSGWIKIRPNYCFLQEIYFKVSQKGKREKKKGILQL